jgi:hypothetical protein
VSVVMVSLLNYGQVKIGDPQGDAQNLRKAG